MSKHRITAPQERRVPYLITMILLAGGVIALATVVPQHATALWVGGTLLLFASLGAAILRWKDELKSCP